MRSPSPSQLTATRIPKITDLREQLCYGDASLARCTSFIDDLRVFRKRHPYGTRLFEWKSSQDQAVLKALTTAFLDKNNFGEIYWPSDPDSRNFNPLQYSKDRVFIHRTLRQLLFRLNLQQYRNNKYKKKEQQPEPDPDPDPKPNNIIEIHSDGSPTRYVYLSPDPLTEATDRCPLFPRDQYFLSLIQSYLAIHHKLRRIPQRRTCSIRMLMCLRFPTALIWKPQPTQRNGS